MKQITIFILTLIFWGIQACEKPGDNEPNVPPPPPLRDSTNTNPLTSKSDSVLLLTKVVSSGSPGTLLFEYDNENRVKQVTKPFTQADPIISVILYQNGKISNIISQQGSNSPDKVSAIFYYNATNKCNKVVYKSPRCCLANDNPYYSTVTDSNYVASWDTLIYNSYGQLSQINKYQTGGRIADAVRFIYNSGSDTIPFQLEKTYPSWSYGLLIYTSNMEHPALRQMWFLPFLAHTTYLAGTSFMVSLPLLFDDRGGSALDEYLSFFPKCVTSYKASENGQWSSGLGGFVYSYSADSLTFQGVIPNAWPAVTAKFTFTKVKK
ncbi:MAG TPA: hypothetical protein VF008_11855 [Niastella sp.]